MMRQKPISRSPTPCPVDGDPADTLTQLALEGPAPYLVRRLQQLVTAIFSEEMERFDVTAPQYAALSVVVAVPNLDQNTTAFIAGVERTTIVGVINRLVRKGLLKRARHKDDKRVRLLQPTEAGMRFVRDVSAPIERIGARLLEPLPEDQRSAFCETIKQLLRESLRAEARQLSSDPAQTRQLSSRQKNSRRRSIARRR